MACFRSMWKQTDEEEWTETSSTDDEEKKTKKSKQKKKLPQKRENQIYILTIAATCDELSDSLSDDGNWSVVMDKQDMSCPVRRVAWYVGYDILLERYASGHDFLAPWNLQKCKGVDISVEEHTFRNAEDRDTALAVHKAAMVGHPKRQCKRSNHSTCRQAFAVKADKTQRSSSSSCQICGQIFGIHKCTKCGGPMCARDKDWCKPFWGSKDIHHTDYTRKKGRPWCSNMRVCALCECPSDSSSGSHGYSQIPPPAYEEAVPGRSQQKRRTVHGKKKKPMA